MGDIDVSKQIKKLRQEFYKSEKGINNAKKLLNDVITLLNTKGKNKFADELKKNFADANKEINETTKNIKKAEIDPKKLAINNLKQVGKEAKSKGDVGLYKRIKGFESTLNFNSSDKNLSDLNSRISYLEKQLRKTYGNSVADKFKEQVVKDPAENISPELEKQLALQEEQRKKEEEKLNALKREKEIRKTISQNMKDISSISKMSGNKEISDMAKSFGQNIKMSFGQKEAISNQEIMIEKVQETRKLVEELGSDYVKAFDDNIGTAITNQLNAEAEALAQKNLENFKIEQEKNRILEQETQKIKEQNNIFSRLKEMAQNFKNSVLGIKEINTNLDIAEDKVENINAEVEEQNVLWKKVGSVLKTVFSVTAIKVFFQKVAQGIRTIYRGITAVVDTGGALLETQNLFEVAMGENIEKAEAFQSAMHEAFGANIEETKRYQAYFSQMSTSLGIASDEAYTLSQGLTKLGMDISSLYNISQESAMQKLRAGLAGQTKSLRDVGLDITQQSLTPIAQELGITRSVKNLSQAEKILLRYVTVLKQANSAHGDMAKTIEQPANQLKVLQNQLKELARAISNVFLPILKNVLPYINGFLMALKEIINMLAVAVGYTEDLSTSVASNDTDIDLGLGDDVEQAKELNKSLGIDELNVLSQNEDDTGGLGGIDPALLNAIKDYENGMESIRMKALDIRDAIMGWLGYIQVFDEEGNRIGWELGEGYTNLEKIRDILITISGLVLIKGIADLISKVILLKTKLQALSSMGKIAIGITLAITGLMLEADGIKDTLENGLSGFNFTEILLGGLGIVSGGALTGKAIGTITIAGKAIAGSLLGASIGAIVAGIPAFIVGIYDAIKNGIDWLSASLIAVGATATGAGIGALIGSVVPGVGTAIGALVGLIVGLLTDLGIWLYQHWEEVTTAIGNFFTVTIPELWNKFVTWLGELPAKIGYWLGELVGSIVLWGAELLDKIKKFFTETIPELWNKFTTWLSTIPEKLHTFFTVTIPEKVNELIEFLKGLPEKFLEFGKNIVQGILDGITQGWTTLKEKWSEFIDGFIQGFKDKLGIHSPSKVFNELGENITDGLEQGIGDGNGALDSLNVLSAESVEKMKEAWVGIPEWFSTNVITPLSNIFSEFELELSSKLSNINNIVKGKISLLTDVKIPEQNTKENSDTTEILYDIDGDISVINNSIEGTAKEIITKLTNMTAMLINGLKEVRRSCENIKINVTKVISGGGGSSGSSGGSLLSKITSTIRGYATGGMPESGEMFYANENGMPELVGRIGTKTTVMNNAQIVQAVSNGVANAVSRVFASQAERPINVSVQVDDREIARANNSGQKKLGHKIVGGAFAKG